MTVGADHVVRLTAAGRRARGVWAPLAGEIEGRWRERFGARAVARLREALERVPGEPGPALPRYLPIVGYAMVSEVVPASEPCAAPSPPGRHDLSVLLARTLLRFTLDFEAGSPLSLPVGRERPARARRRSRCGSATSRR